MKIDEDIKEVVLIIDKWIVDSDYWGIECIGKIIKHYRIITTPANNFNIQKFLKQEKIKILQIIEI